MITSILYGLTQIGGGLAVLTVGLIVWHLTYFPKCCQCYVQEHNHDKHGTNVHPTNGFLRHAVVTTIKMFATVYMGVMIIPVSIIIGLVWICCKILQFVGFFKKKEEKMMTPEELKSGGRNVAIIGAGPSALIAAKECMDMGHTVTLFERKKVLGGAFNAYYKAQMTSSSFITAFSHLPMHKSTHGEYLLLIDYLKYLNEFAKKFGIYDKIKFNSEIIRCDGTIDEEPDKMGNRNVLWEIDTVDADEYKNGNTGAKVTSYKFDRLIVCCGIAQKPRPMKLNIEEGAEDRIVHSNSFDLDPNSWKQFKDKKVVVLGAGESAADIGYFICGENNGNVIFLQRECSKTYYIPRVSFGRPTDAVVSRDMWKLTPFNKLLVGLAHLEYLEERPCDNSAVLDAVHSFQRRDSISGVRSCFHFTCKNENMFRAILERGAKHQVGEVDMIKKNGDVILKDGGVIKDVDKIIAAVGFKPDLTLIRVNGKRIYTPNDYCPRKLLWHIFDPQYGDALAFVGYLRPTLGGLPPLSELAARLVALIFNKNSGKKVPNKMEAIKIRDRQNKWDRYVIGDDRRFNDFGILVEFTSTLERLASAIGCVPDIFDLFLNDPLLWHGIHCRTLTTAQYRIHGPGKFDYNMVRSKIIKGWSQAPHVQLGMAITSCLFHTLTSLGITFGPPMM